MVKHLIRFEGFEDELNDGRTVVRRARLKFGAYQLKPGEMQEVRRELSSVASGAPYVYYTTIEADAVMGEIRGSYSDVKEAMERLEEMGWTWE